MSLGDVSKLCGEAWKKLSETERAEWKAKSQEKQQEIKKNLPHVEEQEKKPKRPTTSYIVFSIEERKKISKEFPTLRLGEISKRCGEAWKALSDEEKNTWKVKAQNLSC